MAIQWRRPAAVGRLPALSSRSGAGGADWFDRWAYRGTVTVGTDSRLHTPAPGLTVDQDVTWVSQWGKCVDITLRLECVEALELELVGGTILVHIDGIGITMGSYQQRVWLGYRDDSSTSLAGFSMHPFLLSATNGTDWRAGYDVRQMEEDFPVANGAVWSGNVNLITRTYFKDGVLHAEADDFRPGGM